MTTPSDPHTPTPAAGWFPDPSGGAGSRWWDGQQWTDHVSDPALEAFGAAAVPGKVDPATPVYTPYIWLITLVLPLLSLVTLLFWDMDAYIRATLESPNDPVVQLADPGYLLVQGVGFVLYGLSVVFAFLDRRVLLQRGFDRPFHWAWTFLGGVVYIIGRSVIVRRRSGTGLLPIWVYIGVFVLSMIIVSVKVSQMISTMMTVLPTLS